MAGEVTEAGRDAAFVDRLAPDLLALLLWLLLVAAGLILRSDAIAPFRYPDPDDAMRLAQVRDLIAGQGWFDIRQYRVDPGSGGALMHWSRFIDAWIAGLILALQPLLGEAAGERWALALYPLLLILPLLLLIGRILAELGDRRFVVVGLLIASTGISFLQFFVPLRIDHHNWQLLLSLAMVWIALRPPGLANGLAGAVIITLYAEISLEGLPYLAIFGALFAVDWLRDPRTAPRLAGFAGGLIIFPSVWILTMRGPQAAATVFCDSFSLPYVAAVAAAAAVIAAWLSAPAALSTSMARRLAALAMAGAVGSAAFLTTGQQCLGGPFGALDPLVRLYWYDRVWEGRPVWAIGAPYATVYIAPTLVGVAALAASWHRARGGASGAKWTRAGVIMLAFVLLSLFVARMGAAAHAVLIPAFAAMAIGLWRWGRARRSMPGRVLSALLVFAAVPVVDTALGFTLLSAAGEVRSDAEDSDMRRGSCPSATMLAALAKERPTHLFAPIDIGPALLIRTPHSVVATGHHRTNLAMRRTIAAFLADPDAAEAIVRAERAQYLVACVGLAEVDRFARNAPQGLAARLVRGEPVDWLRPDPRLSSGALHVYRVVDAEAGLAGTKPSRH